MTRTCVLALTAAVTLSACGGDGSGQNAAKEERLRVKIATIAFAPDELHVSVGDTVTWTNRDESVKHTVTSGKAGDRGVPGLDNGKPDRPDGLFNGTLETSGDEFEFTFEERGSFEYFCRVHPIMTARVIVSN